MKEIDGLPEAATTADAATPKSAATVREVWRNEPDRKEWVDDDTGYACLAQRGPAGAWCGYVGVPPAHAAHGLPYDSYGLSAEEALAIGPKGLAVRAAISKIEAHGGLTFSGKRDHELASEATHWFGFDCSHAGDYSPKYDRLDDPHSGLGRPTGWGGVITYRTLEYVEGEIAGLARQLAVIDGDAKQSSTRQTADDASGMNQSEVQP